MATQNAAAVSADVLSPGPVPIWDHVTEKVLVTNHRIKSFIAATDDDQAPHVSDDAARALPFGFKGRITHGALIRDVAVNKLIQRHLAEMLKIGETHTAIDQGGSYKPYDVVYPGEFIFVRLRYIGRARPKGTFPMKIEYGVFLLREGREIMVMDGVQEALIVYMKK
jgi:acyl dehydratase